jgi:hypothetical protein
LLDIIMSLDLKETVSGLQVSLDRAPVCPDVARSSLDVRVFTHGVIGEITTRLSVLKSDHISGVDVLVTLLQLVLSEVDHLPFVEVLGAVGLELLIYFDGIWPSQGALGSVL